MTRFVLGQVNMGSAVSTLIASALLVGLVVALAPLSAPASADGDSDPLIAPSNLVIGEHESRLYLNWKPETEYNGFDVEYKQKSATEWTDARHCGLWSDWHLTHLENSTEYDIRVRTIRQGSFSDWLTGSGTPRAKPRTVETGFETLWSSTLNAKRMGLCAAAWMAPRIGCDDFYPVETEYCSTGLSTSSFTVDGTLYTVKALYQGDRSYGNNAVVFWVAPNMAETLYGDIRLHIEGLTLELHDATHILQVDPDGDIPVNPQHRHETLFVFYPPEHQVSWSSLTNVSLSRPESVPENQGQYLGGESSGPDGDLPGQMRDVSVRQTDGDRIRIDWKLPAEGGAVGKYQVVLSRDGEQLKSKHPGARKRHVVFRNLVQGATYAISVQAKNEHGLGPAETVHITIE